MILKGNLTILAMSTLFFLTGCASPPRHFELATTETAIVFPQPPNNAKIAYVGTVIGESNLVLDTPGTSALQKVATFIIGLPRRPRQLENVVRPIDVVLSDDGVVSVVDGGKKAVLQISRNNGTVKWLTAIGELQTLVSPVAAASVWNGQLAVSDSELGVVVLFDAQGQWVRNIGRSMLERPVGLAVGWQHERRFVADSKADDIKVFDRDGSLLEVIGFSGTELGEFNGPTYLALRYPWLAVSDTLNSRIQLINLETNEMRLIGQRGLYVGNFVRPKGVAFDSEFNLYAIESVHDHLLIYSLEGDFLMALGGNGQEHGQFDLPSGIFIDNEDRIYVTDTLNGRVEIFQYLGNEQ